MGKSVSYMSIAREAYTAQNMIRIKDIILHVSMSEDIYHKSFTRLAFKKLRTIAWR